MKTPKIHLALIIGACVVAVYLLVTLVSALAKPKISSNILSLTLPVYSFTGTVEKVSGDTITVRYKGTTTSPNIVAVARLNAQGEVVAPSPAKPVNFVYTVTVTDKTVITRTSEPVPFLLRNAEPVVTALKAKDIVPNTQITVNTDTDLRTLPNQSVKASGIILPVLHNTVSGIITEVGTDAITLRTGSESNAKKIEIRITDNTEISNQTVPQEKPRELRFSELKIDMMVTVYTKENIEGSGPFTALRVAPSLNVMPAGNRAVVSPVPPAVPPVPPVVTTPSVTTSPAAQPPANAARIPTGFTQP